VEYDSCKPYFWDDVECDSYESYFGMMWNLTFVNYIFFIDEVVHVNVIGNFMTNCSHLFQNAKSYFEIHNYEHYMTIASYILVNIYYEM